MEGRGDRLRSEQIRLLYRSGPIGIVAAMIGAFALAGILYYRGGIPKSAIEVWVLIVIIDVILHLSLIRAYHRATSTASKWNLWARGFTGFALVEGLIWGMTSFRLAVPAALDQHLLIMLVCCAVTSGTITAYGIYLPAFYALFLPATVPFAAVSVLQGGGLSYAIASLVVMFIVAMTLIAAQYNRNVLEILRLRFENLDLAQRLGLQKEAAEEAARAKSRFLAAASHDLRQPVHALSLLVGALRGYRLDGEPGRLLDRIDASVDAMNGLFNALLDISRLDAGIVEPNIQPFRVQTLLDRIHRDYSADAGVKGVSLRVHPCSAIVSSDPVLLERILRNLVSNAVRYTASGRIVVGCRRGKQLTIQVCDTGPGIAAQHQERIFEEFFQLENPERDRSKGLGLGLAIVRRLAPLLDHRITLSSTLNKGSVFNVTVPLTSDSPLEPTAQRPDEEREASSLILVIDDEAAILEGMRSLLSSWGHTVVCARSGEEMLREIQSGPCQADLIICDYRLQGEESGPQVIRRLRSVLDQDTPALLITGDTAPDRLHEARRSGFVVLHKPVANGRLRAAVSNLIRNSKVETLD
jgi:signal transduction histidine kinase/CheY-like chemotaxis protein